MRNKVILKLVHGSRNNKICCETDKVHDGNVAVFNLYAIFDFEIIYLSHIVG